MGDYLQLRLCIARLGFVLASFVILQPATADPPADVYATYGVHNPPSDSPCAEPTCAYTRKAGEPTDPRYPDYWTSHWTMYRISNSTLLAKYAPPYDGAPPKELKPGVDYEISYGETFYDSTWRGPSGEGAMMEHYETRCLPIFPISNHFTCSFISLGDIAFFVTYDEDRPSGMPPVCLFSPLNHPPRPDFISHLPYSAGDSAQLGDRVQGYSFWIDPQSGKPIQAGVQLAPPNNSAILFGYAFMSEPTPDRIDRAARPYRHPQSFYFSGYPLAPANAPMVSQNYTDFAMIRPDPKTTWDTVGKLDPMSLPPCQLFNPPPLAAANAAGVRAAATWGDIRRAGK